MKLFTGFLSIVAQVFLISETKGSWTRNSASLAAITLKPPTVHLSNSVYPPNTKKYR